MLTNQVNLPTLPRSTQQTRCDTEPGGPAANMSGTTAEGTVSGERLPYAAFLVTCGILMALSYVGPVAVQGVTLAAIPTCSAAAMVVGAFRYESPGRRQPWLLLATAQMIFLADLGIRVALARPVGLPGTLVEALPDLIALPGYGLLVLALARILGRRQATQDHAALVDSWIIGIGAALMIWVFMIAPKLFSAGAPVASVVLTGLIPTIDVLVVVFITHLVMADGARTPALRLIAVALALMFVFDMCYEAVQLGTMSAHWLLLANVLPPVGFAALGASALHPSMRELSEPKAFEVHTMGMARTLTIAAVLVAPTVLATQQPPDAFNAAVRIALTCLLTIVFVWRILRTTMSWQRAELAERWRATHDSLTSLGNRELLIDTIAAWNERAGATGTSFGLLYIDLDRFKSFNDGWGHQTGDELLRAVAQRLGAMVRGNDLVCRMGADEFVIAATTPEHTPDIAGLAQRVVSELAKPFELPVGKVIVTTSVGVAESWGDVEAPDLIRNADTAMYKAKAAGRNGYACYDTDLRERACARAQIEQALRGALDRGELSVVYQPIVDLQTDALSGFEALMRWNHPQLGAISPVDFIPIAEDTGLIVASGAWMLEQATAQLATWFAEYPAVAANLHVSVNMSVRQLRDPTLVEQVRRTLASNGLPASALWLEVTESGVMTDPSASLAILRALRDLGTTICIDDFGTGHSSLSYLTQLPARIVKIDRSLVQGVGEGGENEAIVRSVISLAHILDRTVVAEGVETVVQRDWLRRWRCDLVQGYLYDRPTPAAQAERDWVDARQHSAREATAGR